MSAPADTVVCFGEALIDLLAQPPPPGAAAQFTEYAGGAPANTAVAVARLGGRARFIGMLAEDFFGARLLAQLAAAGVDVSCVRRTAAARTALAFVALDAHGERSFSFYRPPAADLLYRASDFEPCCFAGAAVFHVCSNSLTEAAIAAATLEGLRQARAAGALLSIDLNLRPALWPAHCDPRPRLWAALEQAELVKLDRSELEFLAAAAGGSAAVIRRLLAAQARCVLVTDGAAPLHWHTHAGEGTLAGFRVDSCDSTAAGDAFSGGWLQALVSRGATHAALNALLAERASFEACLRYAAACGALATTRHGAFAAMPQAAAVETLLRTQSPAA
jgi:fructokinase